MLILNQFGIIQNLQTSPIPQTSFFVGTFFDVSYSKTALAPVLLPALPNCIKMVYGSFGQSSMHLTLDF